MHIQSPDILFKRFQGYLGTFRDIDVYSATLTGHSSLTAHTHWARGKRKSLPCPFWNRKSVLILERKTLILSILGLIFSIQNEVLRVSRRQISKMFPCGTSFSCVFSLVPQSPTPALCPEKFLVPYLHSGVLLFAKSSILNVWHCSEYSTGELAFNVELIITKLFLVSLER